MISDGLPADFRVLRISSTVSSGMPGSSPPYRPRTGALSAPTTSIGYWGCSSVRLPVSRPYQATPALSWGLWAAYSQTILPPQQNPVMPSFGMFPLPPALAHATVAARSAITCASGTFDTTFAKISLISDIPDTSPWRGQAL